MKTFVTVASAVLLFLIMSCGVTAIYWTVGGTFHWSWPLAVYLAVELYLLCLIIKIAYSDHTEEKGTK